jgi:hypothetical protein
VLSFSSCPSTFRRGPQITAREFISLLMDVCHESTNCRAPVTARKRGPLWNSVITPFVINASHEPWCRTCGISRHSNLQTIKPFNKSTEALPVNVIWLKLPPRHFFSNSAINWPFAFLCLSAEGRDLIWDSCNWLGFRSLHSLHFNIGRKSLESR